MKILITSYHNPFNKGEASIMNAMVIALQQTIPESDITILSLYPDIDPMKDRISVVSTIPPSSHGQHGKIRAVALILLWSIWAFFYRLLKLRADRIVGTKLTTTLQAYAEADVIVSRGNDSLTDAHGLASFVMHLHETFLSTLLGKPVMIYAHTIGPFSAGLKGKICKKLTGAILNRVDLITVRDETSKALLEQIKVNHPSIHLTADSALILPTAPAETVSMILSQNGITREAGKPLVGIVPSAIYDYGFLPSVPNTKKKRDQYVHLMVQTIDHLTNALNVSVVIIVHVSGPIDYTDKVLAHAVYDRVQNKEKVKMIDNDYTCQELKGVIGACDMLVSARMHPIIHALSMSVPVVAIDYTYKMAALLHLFHEEELVCNLGTLNANALMSTIDTTFYNRTTIKQQLTIQNAAVKEKSMLNAKLLRDLIETRVDISSRDQAA